MFFRTSTQRFTALVLALGMLLQSAPVVYAVPQNLDLNQVCCERNYTVYGEDQPQMVAGKCVVQVDLEAEIDTERPDESPQTATDIALENNPVSGIAQGVQGLLTPLAILWKESSTKRVLFDLAAEIFSDHTEPYHDFLDDEVFEKAIEKVSSLETSELFNKFVQEKLEGQCADDNPLTHCVAERALCSYEKYSRVLFFKSGEQLIDDRVGANLQTDDAGQLINMLQSRDLALVEEVRHAEVALDTALAVYAQFMQTYRLHLRFKDIIEALVKVRNMTSYLHQLVSCVPNKFVGVATTKCN